MLSARPAPGAHIPSRSTTSWRQVDWLLAAAVAVIGAFGCLMVYSASKNLAIYPGSTHVVGKSDLHKQALFMAIGAGVMLFLARVDYRRWRDVAPILYGLSIFLLLAVYLVGHHANGAVAWFQIGPFELEPSEFAKFALVLSLAAYAASFKGDLPLRGFLTIIGMTLVPFALVYKQPDLGTALVLLAVLLVVLLIAGARARHLASLVLVGVVVITAAVELGVLQSYQEARLTSFASTPDSVSGLTLSGRGAQNIYNVVQSKDAISDGGVLGKGVFKGPATNTSLVPEQQTDFIFSAAGEQVGLVGCVLLLALFLLVLWRTWLSATLSRDLFGTLVCVGVLAMLLFQIFENVGMTMGIMPVAGIPLPWMSYGGSAVVIEFAAIGLVLSVRMHRFA